MHARMFDVTQHVRNKPRDATTFLLHSSLFFFAGENVEIDASGDAFPITRVVPALADDGNHVTSAKADF